MISLHDVSVEFANKIIISRTDLPVPRADMADDIQQRATRQAFLVTDMANAAAATLIRRQAAESGTRLSIGAKTDPEGVAAMGVAMQAAIVNAAAAQLESDRQALELLKKED